MTRQQTLQAASVMLAWLQGLRIEHRYRRAPEGGGWSLVIDPHACRWDFLNFDYRIHPDDLAQLLSHHEP